MFLVFLCDFRLQSLYVNFHKWMVIEFRFFTTHEWKIYDFFGSKLFKARHLKFSLKFCVLSIILISFLWLGIPANLNALKTCIIDWVGGTLKWFTLNVSFSKYEALKRFLSMFKEELEWGKYSSSVTILGYRAGCLLNRFYQMLLFNTLRFVMKCLNIH